MTNICPGCGSTLQSKDENKMGYTPIKNAKICQRCFKLKNYNQKEIVELKYSNNDIISLINSNADHVYFITDFLNISNKVIDVFKKIKRSKTLIINKTDYIPKSINKEKYSLWIKETYNINDNIIFISALKKHNLNELLNKISLNKNNYICGFTNSGKSTIINSICELCGKKSMIVASLMPNTTLDLIKINIAEKSWLYDTPGFINNNEEFNSKLYPKKYLKPVTFQMKKDDVLSLDDKIFIKNSSDKNSFTFYMSNDVKIKKVYNQNINFDNELNVEENSEIFIEEYGFINIKNECNILINSKKIEVRKSMF